MPLGYKYAERDVTSEVDWSAIGKGLTDMLSNEEKIREQKKEAIDKSTREYANRLSQPPQGEHVGMNQWALNYANDAQQARLLQDKLLRSGRLKLKDYTIQRQNLIDGTDQMFNLTKEYQDEYNAKMEAYKNGELQSLTLDNMKDVEGFSNFLNTKAYINPTDYSLSVGKMVKNADTGVMEMSQNPNDFSTVNSLRNRIKATYNKYDMQGNVKAFVDGLGTEIDSVAKLGSIYKTGTITETLTKIKTKDLPAYTNFEKAETAALEARLGTIYDYTSVLTENIKIAPNGKPYSYTWDEKEAKGNPNLLLKKIDSNSGNITVDLTDKQKSDVIEHMRTEARLMYDNKTTIKETEQFHRNDTPAYLLESWKNKKDKESQSRNLAKNFVKMAYGDTKQSDLGATAMSTATGFQFEKDGKSFRVYSYDKNGAPDLTRTVKFNAIDENNVQVSDKDLNDAVGSIAQSLGVDPDTFVRYVNEEKRRGGYSKFNTKSNVTGFKNIKPASTGSASGGAPR